MLLNLDLSIPCLASFHCNLFRNVKGAPNVPYIKLQGQVPLCELPICIKRACHGDQILSHKMKLV